MMLYLKAANLADMEQEYLFVRNMPEDENGLTNLWHDISHEAFPAALQTMMDWAEGRHLPDGYVPETFLFLWHDDEIVGQFRIRHRLCASLRDGAGHIGYYISPKYRGRGYGTEGLRLTLQRIQAIIPENEVYLRVNKDNPASLRVMLKNGGIIHHEDENKFYVRIKKDDLA